MKYKTLFERMHSQRVTSEAMAVCIGKSKAAVYDKLNGKTEFTVSEILKIKDFLGLSELDMKTIFFDQEYS